MVYYREGYVPKNYDQQVSPGLCSQQLPTLQPCPASLNSPVNLGASALSWMGLVLSWVAGKSTHGCPWYLCSEKNARLLLQ